MSTHSGHRTRHHPYGTFQGATAIHAQSVGKSSALWKASRTVRKPPDLHGSPRPFTCDLAMTTVFVDTIEITDWPSFHRVFSQIFGFPAFYGNNMDALIDCLSYLDEPEVEMTEVWT